MLEFFVGIVHNCFAKKTKQAKWAAVSRNVSLVLHVSVSEGKTFSKNPKKFAKVFPEMQGLEEGREMDSERDGEMGGKGKDRRGDSKEKRWTTATERGRGTGINTKGRSRKKVEWEKERETERDRSKQVSK